MISTDEAKEIAGKTFKQSFDINKLIEVKDRLVTEQGMVDGMFNVWFGLFPEKLKKDIPNYADIILQVAVNLNDGSVQIIYKLEDVLC